MCCFLCLYDSKGKVFGFRLLQKISSLSRAHIRAKQHILQHRHHVQHQVKLTLTSCYKCCCLMKSKPVRCSFCSTYLQERCKYVEVCWLWVTCCINSWPPITIILDNFFLTLSQNKAVQINWWNAYFTSYILQVKKILQYCFFSNIVQPQRLIIHMILYSLIDTRHLNTPDFHRDPCTVPWGNNYCVGEKTLTMVKKVPGSPPGVHEV